MTRSLGRLEAGLLLLALSLALLASTADWSFLHPGYNAYDEEAAVAQVQARREGAPLRFRLGQGSLNHWAQSASAALAGPSLGALHFPAAAALVLEVLLLLAWGRRLGSLRAGLWAALIGLAAPMSWVRARSLLSFSLFPVEALAAAWVLPRRGAGPWRAAAIWAGLSLLLLDYELWLAGLPLLFLLWLLWQRPTRGEALAGAAGLGLAALTLALVSGFDPSAWWQVRRGFAFASNGADPGLAARLVAGLRMVCWGGEVQPYFGVAQAPWFPLWAWPFLGLGLLAAWRRARLPAALALAGLAPLLLTRSQAEPQRLLLAWPALCLLVGLGAAAFIGRRRERLAFAALVLALGSAWGWRQFQASQDQDYARTYGAAADRQAAAKALCRALPEGKAEVLSDLCLEGGLCLRFHLDEAGLKPGGPLVAAAPWDLFPQGGPPSWGRWMAVDRVPGIPPFLWLLPAPAKAQDLRREDARLKAFWRSAQAAASPVQRLALAEAALQASPAPGPWAYTVLAGALCGQARDLGGLPPDRVQALLKGPLLGGGVQQSLAETLAPREPMRALALAQAAAQADPRRLEAWTLQAGILRKNGHETEARALEAHLRTLLQGPPPQVR